MAPACGQGLFWDDPMQRCYPCQLLCQSSTNLMNGDCHKKCPTWRTKGPTSVAPEHDNTDNLLTIILSLLALVVLVVFLSITWKVWRKRRANANCGSSPTLDHGSNPAGTLLRIDAPLQPIGTEETMQSLPVEETGPSNPSAYAGLRVDPQLPMAESDNSD